MTADGAGEVEGIGVPAIVGNFAESEAGGADELDGALDLEAPDHSAWAFAPGIAAKRAEPAGGDADAPGEILGGMKFGVVDGGDVKSALKGGMKRGGGVTAIKGTDVGGETEQTGPGEGGHGVVKFGAAVIWDGEPFLNEKMNGGGGLVDTTGTAEKAAVYRGEKVGQDLAPGVGRCDFRGEAVKFAGTGKLEDGFAGGKVVGDAVDGDVKAALNQDDKLKGGLDTGPAAPPGRIDGLAKEIAFRIPADPGASAGGGINGLIFGESGHGKISYPIGLKNHNGYVFQRCRHSQGQPRR